MDLEEYGRRKQQITDSLLLSLAATLLAFLVPGITPTRWRTLIQGIYPRVKQARDEAAVLAQQFFDDNRSQFSPDGDDERVDFYRDEHYPVEWLTEAVDLVYDRLQKQDADSQAAIQDMSNRLIKVVEDGARRTLLNGVEADRQCLGWARYDPRPPTCAFCAMMISRGPAYKSARTAGADLDDESAAELWEIGDYDAMNAMMNRWHPGCTCVVAPVYTYENYPTEQQEISAFAIYRAGRELAGSGNFKEILKAMRRLLRDRANKDEDEVRLPSN